MTYNTKKMKTYVTPPPLLRHHDRHAEQKVPDSEMTSDEEEIGGDFTVYECPGLAPVGWTDRQSDTHACTCTFSHVRVRAHTQTKT